MPISINKTTLSERTAASPLLGPVDHTVQIEVDLSALTSDEIDEKGWLKAGIPLTKAGALLVATNFVYGITIEPIKVAANNEAGTLAALGVQHIAVAVIGVVLHEMAVDLLGRAYTAAEIAGFDIAGSKLVLVG